MMMIPPCCTTRGPCTLPPRKASPESLWNILLALLTIPRFLTMCRPSVSAKRSQIIGLLRSMHVEVLLQVLQKEKGPRQDEGRLCLPCCSDRTRWAWGRR